ncbi:MAG TPA: IPT/TIG domain-containing protein, partial [Candidatus Methylomirabilis sp.]|nr:IPT/TIG domain-containing protein [Candidatus Methylomirabilis sp.]
SLTTKKVIVKVVFNKPVESPAPAAAVSVEKLDGTPVAGTVSANPDNNKELRFVPAQPCPPPNDTLRCYDDNTDYRVKVSPSLKALTGATIVCGGFAPSCEGAFKSGTTVDVTPPNVTVTYPVNGGSVSADALVDVNAYATDESGIAYVSFNEGTNAIGDSAPQGSSPLNYDAHVQWDTAGVQSGTEHTLTATAYDVDSGVKKSDPVTVIVRAAHCFNGSQDQGETGIDCGGDQNSPEYCGACSGSSCTQNSQCASGVCANSVCVEQPTITSVTPNDGAVGSYVTLKGVNFGTNGTVTFLGPPGDPGVEAKPPQACVDYGTKTWSPTEVIVEVPAAAKSGPIRLTNSASGLADATNAPPNPFINDFLVNDALRPGICAADPNAGTAGQLFKLVGKGFGTTAAGIQFGDKVISTTSWTDGETQALIPNVSEKTYPVTITVNQITSNPVGIQVLSKTGGGPPEITSIDPASGPVGAYVTITGTNFTDSVGTVVFKEIATGNEALADTSFPPACSLAFWSNASIVVKVPTAFTKGAPGVAISTGAYTVRVTTPVPGTPSSNEVNFAVNTDPATPGICAVVPSVAPIGTAVEIYGERFTSGPGKVTFFQNKNGTATPWTNTQVSSVVPTGAQTGPVTVSPASSGLASNGFKIEVRNCNEAQGICKTGDECCGNGACMPIGQCKAGSMSAMYAWRTSTGVIPLAPRVVEECKPGQGDVIPSPTPWDGRPGGNQACVNAPVVMRFTSKLEPSTVKSPAKNFHVLECTAGGNDPCAKTAELAIANGYPELKTANPTQDYV